MSTIQIMTTGGPNQRIQVRAFGQDNVNSVSQVQDSMTSVSVNSATPSVATAVVDPSDGRSIIVTPSASTAGTAFFQVDESPPLIGANRLQFAVSVVAPIPDNRRIEFVTATYPA